MSAELAVVEKTQRREITQVIDAVPINDTARFEHMQRIANVMARSTMIPETLRTIGTRDNKEDLPFEQVLSNCFLVVNQATRWGMDPFAVISCCSVVHGRLSYEGKLVTAVLDAKLGIQLHYYFTGEPATEAYRIYVSDHPFTEEVIAQLVPSVTIPGILLWDGSVAEWKTAGAGTPWIVKNYKRMLIYRGSRDWARIHKPAIMLGVYTEDELLDLSEDVRARRATPALSLRERLEANAGSDTNGFSQGHVTREIGSVEQPAADETQDSQTSQATPQPPSPGSETPPAADSVAAQPEPAAGTPPVDGAQPSALPEGWEGEYANALRLTPKKLVLPNQAKMFWESRSVDWNAIKSTPDGETAAAIYNLFKDHFGKTEIIDAQLREMGVAA